MSLTSQLRPDADLAFWFGNVLYDVEAAVGQVRRAAHQGRSPIRPAGQQVPAEHWADVGGAFGQRLADLVSPEPPYGALLGMVRAGWMSWDQAHTQAAAYPSHATLGTEHRARALSMRRTAGGWLDLGPTPTGDRAPNPAAEQVLVELLQAARSYQALFAPPGQFAEPRNEAALARSAWVLSACEGIYRSGKIDPRLDRVLRAGGSVAELRALVAEPVVAELVQLAERAHDAVLGRWRLMAGYPDPGRPLGVAAPTIVPGWADGDLLIGGAGGTTLVDVKTVITLRDAEKVARWLWQILAYAWLDTTGLHQIRSVGLYLARHGALITWEVAELAENMAGSASYEQLYESFIDMAEEVTAAEGARFPIGVAAR